MFLSTGWILRMYAVSTIIICTISCKKEDPSGTKLEAANWEIYSNYPQDKSYSVAKMAILDDKVFLSTYGNFGIQPGSGGSLQDLKGSFFYSIGANNYVYSSSNEAIINLKIFKNELYGITERMIPFMNGAVKSHKHTYFLFKWKNDNFQNLDTLEYTDLHYQDNSPLTNNILWEHNGKLHMLAKTATELKVWTMIEDQLVEQPTSENISVSQYLAIDNEGISFTSYRQTKSTQTYIEEEVWGNYFNGTTFTKGNVHVFFEEDGNPASNRHLFYSTVKGELYGFKNNRFQNFDQGKLVVELPEDRKFRTEGGYIISKNGKIYSVIGDQQLKCLELGIYDGQNLRRLNYKLPDILDPCSKLIDAIENNGKFYLLLLNRGQYVIVYNK